LNAPEFKNYECLVHGHSPNITDSPNMVFAPGFDGVTNQSMRLGFCVRCKVAIFVPGMQPTASDPIFENRPLWTDDE
jgi:hypothetical protein